MKKFKIGRNIADFSDQTSLYETSFSRGLTVGELIDEVLSTTDWGYIGIKDGAHIFGYPVVEYSNGKITTSDGDMDALRNRVITNIDAHGGWSRMDYKLSITEE